MRTTVTLDPDVEAILRKAMRKRDISFKEALNQAIRDGLMARPQLGSRPYRLKTFRMGFRPEFPLEQALSAAAAPPYGSTLTIPNCRK